MKKKKALFVFLAIFAVLFVILSIAVYAYDYLSSLPETDSSSSAVQQSVQSQESSMPVQGFEVQSTDTSTLAGDATPTTYGNNSTHPYGTWNNPYTYGADGYSYTDPEDYTGTAK